MEIIYPPELISFLKHKYLLLDANIFRDAPSQPTKFDTFFNTLKQNGITLATTDLVRFELLKGSSNLEKYNEKDSFIQKVVDSIIVTDTKLYELAFELIKEYSQDGAGVSLTDLLLGAHLKQYKDHAYLLSRDTSAYIQRIFDLKFVVNCPLPKGIFTYGVYGYKHG